MDFKQAKEYAKGQIENYLQQQHDIDTRKNFKCLNPAHQDHEPSMGLDRANNRVKCFACDAKYDIFDLIGIDYGIREPGEQMKKAFSLYGLTIDQPSGAGQVTPSGAPAGATPPARTVASQSKRLDCSSYIDACKERSTDYFKRRGIPDTLITRFKLGFDPNFDRSTGGKTWQAAIIPNGDCSGYVARNTDEKAEPKDRYRKVGAAFLFNPNSLAQGRRPVIVVEGEIDALSILAAGGEAVGLGSTSNKDMLLRELDSISQQVRTTAIVLALDNDTSGRNCAAYLKKGLEARGIKVYIMNLYGNHKDANEALLADPAAFRAAIDQTRTLEQLDKLAAAAKIEEYKRTSAAAHLQEFVNGVAASANTPHISTGFDGLDKVLDGGLYEGLYIIGAISSLGKTTLALQIVDQIAQSGRDCLVFSLEMARNELMSKSISRLSLTGTIESGGDTRNAKTARGITAGERQQFYSQAEKDLIKDSINRYSEYAGNIYIHEGIGDIGVEQIREIVAQHKDITGKSPIVLVDYLQILAPNDPRATDKQNTDKAVLELKRISRDFKIPVIGISSFNRDNYSAPVSMISFKESGAIEYSSDVLIGLQLEGVGTSGFDVDTAKSENPRRIELKILKNRNGATGGAVLYEYYPQFNYFKEAGIIQRSAADRPEQAENGGKVVIKTAAAAEGKKKMTRKAAKQALAGMREAEEVKLVKINND